MYGGAHPHPGPGPGSATAACAQRQRAEGPVCAPGRVALPRCAQLPGSGEPQTFLFNGKPEGRKAVILTVATPNAGCSGPYSRQPNGRYQKRHLGAHPGTCWKTGWTSSPSKNCWGMSASRPRWCICTWQSTVAKRPSVRWIRSSLPGGEAGLRSSAGHTATGEQVERSKQLNHWQKRTLRLIRDCRTAALGGHLDQCPGCSHLRMSYNSCRNRHCPKCRGWRGKTGWQPARRSCCRCRTSTWCSPCPGNSTACACTHRAGL